jgi:flavin reductase
LKALYGIAARPVDMAGTVAAIEPVLSPTARAVLSHWPLESLNSSRWEEDTILVESTGSVASSDECRPFDQALFRRVMGSFASGVTVITAADKDVIHGMTANAFMSGSLEPPLIVCSIGNRASMQRVIRASGGFAINILSERQASYSRHFARQVQLDVMPGFEMKSGIPTLAEALAIIVARVEEVHPCGDHQLFVGKVQHVAVQSGSPLLYFQGDYLPTRTNGEWSLSQHQAWV